MSRWRAFGSNELNERTSHEYMYLHKLKMIMLKKSSITMNRFVLYKISHNSYDFVFSYNNAESGGKITPQYDAHKLSCKENWHNSTM